MVSYLHTGRRTAAIEVAIAVLDEALTVIAATDRGCDGPLVRPVRRAIAEFLETVDVSNRDVAPPPPPGLGPLGTEAGGVVDERRLRDVVSTLRSRRATLRALLEENAWSWQVEIAPPEETEMARRRGETAEGQAARLTAMP